MTPITYNKPDANQGDLEARKDLEAGITKAIADARALRLDFLAYLLSMSLQELIEADTRLAAINLAPEDD